MYDWICDIIFYFQDAFRVFWEWLDAQKIIAIFAGLFAIRAGLQQWGHKFEVMYCISRWIHHQPQISEMYIYNKKNKTEVVTEINVLIGANCALQLHTFEEPLIIPPYEMRMIKFSPISVYAINCDPVNMEEIFNNHKYKKIIALTTPYGIIKAKISKQIPHDTYIADALHKGAFYFIYHRSYPVNNRTLDYKIKYFGDLLINKKINGCFFVYQDGTVKIEHAAKDFLKIDMENLSNMKTIKEIIQKAKLYKKRYTVNIYERSKSIEEVYKAKEEKSVPIFSKFQYFFIEPIVRIYRNRALKKKNSTQLPK